MSDYITKRQAETCLKIISERLGTPGPATPEGPALYEPGHEGPFWNVSYEGGDDWAIRLSHDDTITWPKGVWVEPVASWCLGLHKA